jgi:mRNA interferase RelE/StbE
VNTSRYHVTYAKAAARALRHLDRPLQRRLVDAIDLLATDPRPHGTKALQGGDGLLRIRVGDYRVVYAVYDDQLVVLVATLGHRREVYRNL